ncbi:MULTISPECIES: c-type cytochrome [Capnocytophaga]|uniref:Cytochrome C n=1 Tax=Capnocytophaga canis TaxID=1848903 RepID=A0A0B7I3S0_9FLAO|nr:MULTISPECIES: cytochrome c [Capnocytophaga]ATA72605.1 cytochrome C [Capnocytophaga sp. H4358]ATA74709.1 cytochrome C [Capnocytophaga sp. H2931]RIY36353.1 cytochrome C [Capnocytophaga canis]CEN42607.1 Cytochrome c-553 [Capnocytophaga canis]CEN46290.1 Cytochrome c-553 [Capnocytophaga canis]
MKNIVKIALFSSVSLLLVSCFNKREPNYQFMPNMYESVGYETYQQSPAFKDSMQAQLPVAGTIKRGWQPYEYADTPADLLLAKEELKSPLVADTENLEQGKFLYDIYCAVCHGEKGDGKGILVERGKFGGVPSYADKNRVITPGGTYHVIYYGLNAMGSYASQINEKERWQVALYVEKLRDELVK